MPKKYLDGPKDFWGNICWTDETKVGRYAFCYIWCKTNTTLHKNTHLKWWDGLGLHHLGSAAGQ